MEHLRFEFQGGQRALPSLPQILGVVGSGNLEVLIENAALDGACVVDVATSARGFEVIWQAVLFDFHARWQLHNVRIAINDVGATPAVVSLRLDQAVQASVANSETGAA